MMENQIANQTVTLVFRLTSLEQNLAELKGQLDRYVPYRENDLQLNSIREVVVRMEKEIVATKEQIDAMGMNIAIRERESEKQEAVDRETAAAVQIKVLWTVVSLVFGAIISILVGYITHFFH